MNEANVSSFRKKEIVSEESDWDTNSSDSEADNNDLKRVVVVKKSSVSNQEVKVVDTPAPVKENVDETKIKATNLPREESVKLGNKTEETKTEIVQSITNSKVETSTNKTLALNSSENVSIVKEDQGSTSEVKIKKKSKSVKEKEDATNGEISSKKVVKKLKKKTKDGVDTKCEEVLNNLTISTSTSENLNEKTKITKKKEKPQTEEQTEISKKKDKLQIEQPIILTEKAEKNQDLTEKVSKNEVDVNQSTSSKNLEVKISADGIVKSEIKEKKKKLKPKVPKSEAPITSIAEIKENKEIKVVTTKIANSEALPIDDVTKLVHVAPKEAVVISNVKTTEEPSPEELQSKIDKILSERLDTTRTISPIAHTSEESKDYDLKHEPRDDKKDALVSFANQPQVSPVIKSSAITSEPLIIFDEDKDEKLSVKNEEARFENLLLKKYESFDDSGVTNGCSDISKDLQSIGDNEMSKKAEELFAKYLNKNYQNDDFVANTNLVDKKYEDNPYVTRTDSKLNSTEMKSTPVGDKQRRFIADEDEFEASDEEIGSNKYPMNRKQNEFSDLKVQSTLPGRKPRMSESETERLVDQNDEEFYEGHFINTVGEKKFNVHKNKEGFMASFRKEKNSRSMQPRSEVMFQPRRGEETDEKVKEKTRHVKALVEKQKNVVDNLRNSMKHLNELETIVKEVKTESLDQKVEHENLENLFDVAYDKYENELGLASEYLKQQKKIKTDFKDDISNMLENFLNDGPKQKEKRLSIEMAALNELDPKKIQHNRTLSMSYDNEDATMYFGKDMFAAAQGYPKKKDWLKFDGDFPDAAEPKVQSRVTHSKIETFNEGQTFHREEEGDMTSLSAQDFVDRIRNKYAIPTPVSQTKRKFSSDSSNYLINDDDSKIDAVLENRLKRYKGPGISRVNQKQEDFLSSEMQLQKDNKFSLFNKTSQPFLAKSSLSSIPSSSIRSSKLSYGLKLFK